MNNTTIAAIATPPGSAGIGIIRISGPESIAIASSIFRKSTSSAYNHNRFKVMRPENFSSHRLEHGFIIDPQRDRILDETLISIMRAPRSYTRDDVVEINSHSGTVVLRSILDLVLKMGARLAEPGEFTKIAFINGRIDLTQAEAVMDMITARSEKALAIASTHLQGGMKTRIGSVRDFLVHLLVDIEAAIDFPEEAPEIIDAALMLETLKKRVIDPLKHLLDQYHNAHILRDGLVLAVVGKPNVGKSSLMNRLLDKERVIVSAVPGTTRDFIEEPAQINGIPITIADTAGLHRSKDPVEIMGIRKTREYIQTADLILFVIDGSRPLSREDLEIFDVVHRQKTIIVSNKSDLMEKGRQSLPRPWQALPTGIISALFGQGLDELKNKISEMVVSDVSLDVDHSIIPNLRQKGLLERCVDVMVDINRGLQAGTSPELISIDIKEACSLLGDITGDHVGEDILEQIFNRFCIGK